MHQPLKFIGDLLVDPLRTAMESPTGGFARFSCPDEHTLVKVATQLGAIMPHRDNDYAGVTHIKQTPGRDPDRDVGLTAATSLPHTDCPALERPPKVLLLWCKHAGMTGGQAVVARASEVLRSMHLRDTAAVKAFSDSEAVIFRSGIHSFTGPVFKLAGTSVVEVRLRFDPFIHFSHKAARALPALDNAIQDASETFDLLPGMGYAVRNDLWLHGRTAYSGDREVLRIMVEGWSPYVSHGGAAEE